MSNVTVEKGSAELEKKLKATLDAKTVDSKVEAKLKEVAKVAKIPGFRAGKAVPVAVVKQRYGADIRNEVIWDVLREEFPKILEEQKLQLVGIPSINILKNNPGEDVEFEAIFEIVPDVELKGLDKIKIEKEHASLTEADVDKMIDKLRKQQTQWEAVTRKAKKEDKLRIDFEGFVDDKQFEGGTAKGVDLTLGAGQFIPGFEEALIGAKAGDKKDVKVSFPKDYHVKDLAGKPAVFKCEVHEVQEPKLPEVNDDFAKLFQLDTVEKLREEVKSNMERELEFALKTRVKNQVIDGLMKENKIDIPNALVTTEINRLKEQQLEKMNAYSQRKFKTKDIPDGMFIEQAKRNVALGILFNELLVKYEIKLDKDRVEAQIKKMSAVFEDPKEATDYYQDKAQRANIENAVIEDQLIDKILEFAQVKDKKVNFFDVVSN